MEEQQKSADLHQIEFDWQYLTWWQKKTIVLPLKIERFLDACAMEPWYWLQDHISRRRARIGRFLYPAHWV